MAMAQSQTKILVMSLMLMLLNCFTYILTYKQCKLTVTHVPPVPRVIPLVGCTYPKPILRDAQNMF